jgi:outer membrane protein TolC
MALAEKNLTNARDVLRITEARYKEGALSGLERAQQRTSVANTEATVASLRNQRDLFFNELARMVGAVPAQLTLSGTESFTQLAVPEVTLGKPWELLARRPDIAAAEARLRAADKDIGVARADALPNLSLSLDASVVANPSSTVTGLAASFFAPIFHGGALEGAIDRSKAVRDETQASYEGTLLTAFREVEDALDTKEASDARRNAYTQAADEARKAEAIARTRFDEGSIDFTTFLTTQADLLQAEDNEAAAAQEQIAAHIEAIRALGGPTS